MSYSRIRKVSCRPECTEMQRCWPGCQKAVMRRAGKDFTGRQVRSHLLTSWEPLYQILPSPLPHLHEAQTLGLVFLSYRKVLNGCKVSALQRSQDCKTLRLFANLFLEVALKSLGFPSVHTLLEKRTPWWSIFLGSYMLLAPVITFLLLLSPQL